MTTKYRDTLKPEVLQALTATNEIMAEYADVHPQLRQMTSEAIFACELAQIDAKAVPAHQLPGFAWVFFCQAPIALGGDSGLLDWTVDEIMGEFGRLESWQAVSLPFDYPMDQAGAAEAAGVSRRTIQRWGDDWRLQHFRHGKHKLYLKTELNRHCDSIGHEMRDRLSGTGV
jgi:hypothetical protein